MPYESGKRLKVLNLVAGSLEAQAYWKGVYLQMPVTTPSGDMVPSAYVTLQPENMEGFTNKEKDSTFRLAVILFVRATEHVDREKCRAIDTAEEALMGLQTDTNFEAIASLVDVTSTDPGPVALASLGLVDVIVTPPYGVVRVDVEVTFSYEAIA